MKQLSIQSSHPYSCLFYTKLGKCMKQQQTFFVLNFLFNDIVKEVKYQANSRNVST